MTWPKAIGAAVGGMAVMAVFCVGLAAIMSHLPHWANGMFAGGMVLACTVWLAVVLRYGVKR